MSDNVNIIREVCNVKKVNSLRRLHNADCAPKTDLQNIQSKTDRTERKIQIYNLETSTPFSQQLVEEVEKLCELLILVEDRLTKENGSSKGIRAHFSFFLVFFIVITYLFFKCLLILKIHFLWKIM